jgi:FRG domain
MPWTELYPRTLDDVYSVLNRISDARLYVFRGQASASWKNLRPSLHRVLGEGRTTAEQIDLEAAAIREFRRHGRSLLQVSELDYFNLILGSVTLMQHYGAPTRLLDWTLSPWVACYFAVREDRDEDAAIWAFNRQELDRANHSNRRSHLRDFAAFQGLLSAASVADWAWHAANSGPYIDMFRYEYANPQMGAQQSLFTICGTLMHHDDALQRSLSLPWQLVRVIVPKQHKRELRHQLFRMNVGALNLFPSVDGVGRHISEALQSGFPLGDEGLLWSLEARARRRSSASRKT